MMSEDYAIVSKKDLINFAYTIYNEAFQGYLDLKESVCLSEADRLFNRLQKHDKKSSSHAITVSQPSYVTSGLTIGSVGSVGPVGTAGPVGCFETVGSPPFFTNAYNTAHPGDNSWPVCSISSDPYFRYNGSYTTNYCQNRSNERQLLLFEDSNLFSNSDNLSENDTQDFYSNEGYVIYS